MNKNREIKEKKIEEIKEKLQKAQSAILVKYQGINVEKDTQLRKKLRESGVEYKIYKNTLMSMAAKELNLDGLAPYLHGPLAVAISYTDCTAPARIINEFAKDVKVLELKAGVVQGEIYDEEKVKQLADIPSREVLLSKLLGSFKAPISNLAVVLKAIADKKESENA
ncbi:MAG: 50S ribosomal protein L10 [Oscillospiraceae bacterium]|nr:50S ribosomal protein L10 [Oscillospiraceae bacterium]